MGADCAALSAYAALNSLAKAKALKCAASQPERDTG